MRLNIGIVSVALTSLLAAASTGLAQQPGHADHESKDKPASTMKEMQMPALHDREFTEMMLRHHRHGIELAKLEESRGSREDVKQLATKIREGQERELQELEAIDRKLGRAAESPAPKGTSGHEGHGTAMQKPHQMMEQMSAMSKEAVGTASGPAADEAFLEQMSKHHRMALQMIGKAQLKDAGLRELSDKMAAGQKRELQELKQLQSR